MKKLCTALLFGFLIFSFSGVKAQETIQQDTSKIYSKAIDVLPVFPGGESALMNFLGKNITHPKDAVQDGINGLVVANFTIEKDGSISMLKIVRSLSPSTDAEFLRVIRLMPLWKPGMVNGKPVRVSWNLPMRFK